MKIAWVTDLHVCQGQLPAHREVLNATAAAIEAFRPDLIGIGGDLAGTQVPHRATPGERNLLVEFALRLSDVAQVIAVRGNHDYPGDYDVLNHLRGPVAWSTSPELFEDDDATYGVLTLPWLDLATVGTGTTYAAAVRARYLEALGKHSKRIRELRRRGAPVFAFGHLALADSEIREGQPLLHTDEPTQDPAELFAEVDAAFVGHYHLHQPIKRSPCPAWYGGSLMFGEFGEPGPKGFLTYDTATGEATHVQVPQAGRVVVEVQCPGGEVLRVEPNAGAGIRKVADLKALNLTGCHLKLVGRVKDVEIGTGRTVLAQARAILAPSALSVRQEFKVERTSRERDGAAEIAKLETLPAKVGKFLSALTPPPSTERRESCLETLAELEAELDGSEPPTVTP